MIAKIRKKLLKDFEVQTIAIRSGSKVKPQNQTQDFGSLSRTNWTQLNTKDSLYLHNGQSFNLSQKIKHFYLRRS